MKHRIKRSMPVIMLLCLYLPVMQSQGQISMHFQGLMRDIDYNLIKEDVFKLTVNVLSVPEGRSLWEKSMRVATDDEGWFGFALEEFDYLFSNNQPGAEKVSVHLGLFPLPESQWITQGSDFLVSYTITRTLRNDSMLFNITRDPDNHILQFKQDEDLLLFSDSYPFSHLQAGFAIRVDSSADKLASLRFMIKGDAADSEDAAPSRGVKGGFAVGGYSKKR